MRRFPWYLYLTGLGTLWVALGASASSAPSADPRLPEPEAVAQEESLKLIREVYKEEYTGAKTAAEKSALAAKLLRVAGQSKDDVTGRYVLLRVARDLATQAGDIPTVLTAVEQMGTHYAIDPVGMRGEYFVRAAKEGSQPSHHKVVVERAPELVEASLAKDDYAMAGQICRVALISVRKLRDGAALARLTALDRQVEETAQAYVRVQQMLPKLDSQPTDPEANLIVGRFYCFSKNAWDKGIPLLALGADEALKQVAEKELAGAGAADEKLTLGDAWWDLADRREGQEQEVLRRRAGFWYRQAQDGLSGLARVKVSKRLEELSEAAQAVVEESGPAVLPGKKFSRGAWVDVLDWVEAEKDQVHGPWRREAGGLVAPAARMARLMLPVTVNGSYELEIEFTRTKGIEAVAVILPVGNGDCDFLVSGLEGRFHGFERIDGRSLESSPAGTRPGPLSNNERHTLLLRVGVQGDNALLEAVLDKKPCVRWAGKQQSLSRYHAWIMPDLKRLGLGTHRSEVVFHRIRLRLHSGEALRVAR